jgi:hypothetical protein
MGDILMMVLTVLGPGSLVLMSLWLLLMGR